MRGLVHMKGERWTFRAKLSSGCRLSTPAYKRQEREDGVRFPSSLVTKSKLKYDMVHCRLYLYSHGLRYEQKRRGKNISRRICIGPCTIWRLSVNIF